MVVHSLQNRALQEKTRPLVVPSDSAGGYSSMAKRNEDCFTGKDFVIVKSEALRSVNKPHQGLHPNSSEACTSKDESFNSGRWTDEEHDVFLRNLCRIGKDWKHISEILKTRSPVQVRTHAQKYFLKLFNAYERKTPLPDEERDLLKKYVLGRKCNIPTPLRNKRATPDRSNENTNRHNKKLRKRESTASSCFGISTPNKELIVPDAHLDTYDLPTLFEDNPEVGLILDNALRPTSLDKCSKLEAEFNSIMTDIDTWEPFHANPEFGCYFRPQSDPITLDSLLDERVWLY